MTTINDLCVTSSVSADDKLPIWQNANGVTRALPVSVLDSRYLTQADVALLAISPNVEIFKAGVDFTPGVSLALTLANQYMSAANAEVFFDASFQGPDQYSIAGYGMVFTSPIPDGVSSVYVRGGVTRLVGAPSDGTVTTPKIVDGAVTPAKLEPGSGGFYSDYSPPPVVWKFADRIRMGNSQALNGDLAWSVSPVFTTPFGWQERDSTLFVGSDGRIAISAFSQSSKNTGPFPPNPFFPGAPALNGLAFNDDTTHGSLMWAGYLEAYRVNGAGATYGLELDIGEGGTGVILDPYTFPGSATTGIQVSSGGSTGLPYGAPAGAAYVVGNNGNTFYRGFVVNHDALSSVGGGQAPAAYSMAATQCIAWFNASGNVSTSIVSTVVPGQVNNYMQFNNQQVVLGQNNQPGSFNFNFNAFTAANGISFGGAAAGAAVSIVASGSDTNIDLLLSGKGSGLPSFGTYTAGVVSQAGYITVKDAGGTIRRLLVG